MGDEIPERKNLINPHGLKKKEKKISPNLIKKILSNLTTQICFVNDLNTVIVPGYIWQKKKANCLIIP